MKITDKTEETTVDPDVKRGDIIKREYEGCVEYYLVAARPLGELRNHSPRNILITLATGGNYTSKDIPEGSRLSFYQDIFVTFGDDKLTHIPADQAELVIGG